MAVNDIRSDLATVYLDSQTIAADGDFTFEPIDTSDFGEGIMLAMVVSNYTDGTYALGALESDGVAAPTVVPAEKIIGVASVDSAGISAGDAVPTIGLFSTDKMITPSVNASAVTSGATVEVFAVLKGEYCPVNETDA